MLRKSRSPGQPSNGNAAKYESYKEAWARIRQALEAGFYLEAIVIEESIIADRLTSYLTACGRMPTARFPGLFQLVQSWRQDEVPALDNQLGDLKKAINDDWRIARNDAVHAIVKSPPGTPTTPVDDFLDRAKMAAELGAELARAVDRWHRKQMKAG